MPKKYHQVKLSILFSILNTNNFLVLKHLSVNKVLRFLNNFVFLWMWV